MGESREQTDSGTGEVTAAEQVLNHYVGNTIHMFLSVLAILLLIAAAIMTFEMVIRDFPKLWQPTDEYKALQLIVSDILLIAIAAELGLLLLYHRTSAAVEVIIFVIARKTVSPDTSALELLMSVAALVGLLVARFYYLPGKPK